MSFYVPKSSKCMAIPLKTMFQPSQAHENGIGVYQNEKAFSHHHWSIIITFCYSMRKRT